MCHDRAHNPVAVGLGVPHPSGVGDECTSAPRRRTARCSEPRAQNASHVRAPLRVAAKLETAFTLVELIIVTAIIALLLSILVPAYSKARKQARSVACLSNQRQIATAMTAYTHDYQDRFPISYYDDVAHAAWVEWDTITPHGWPPVAKPGLIWQYAVGGAVQQCPGYDGPSMTSGDPYTGYNYNTTYIGRGQGELPYRGMDESPAVATQLRTPDRTALVGDGGWKNGANKFMRAPFDLDEGSAHAGAQAYRHLDQTNVVFADTHGESVRPKFRKPGARASNEGFLGWPRNGFLSADDRAYSFSR